VLAPLRPWHGGKHEDGARSVGGDRAHVTERRAEDVKRLREDLSRRHGLVLWPDDVVGTCPAVLVVSAERAGAARVDDVQVTARLHVGGRRESWTES